MIDWRWIFTCVLALLLGAALIGWGAGWIGGAAAAALSQHQFTALWIGVPLGAMALLGLIAARRLEMLVVGHGRIMAEAIDMQSESSRHRDLLVASVFGLFLEVMLIRWHSSELMVSAYFKNVSLLAAFLGLGLGFGAAGRARIPLAITPLTLVAQCILLAVLSLRDADAFLRLPSGSEWIWGAAQAEWDWSRAANEQTKFWIQSGVFYGFFAMLYISTIIVFVPIGQLTGRLMRGAAPLRAYTINVFGSLAGVLLFAALSYLWTPPIVWFVAAAAMLLFLMRHEAGGLLTGAIAILGLLGVLGVHEQSPTRWSVYSPYQRLDLERAYVYNDRGERLESGVLISANKAYHLRTANLGTAFVAAHGEEFQRLGQMAAAYGLGGAFMRDAANVLVVGAGGGNDVAAALRHGARHVDAVEIDPAIFEIGKAHHAERPYDDERVTAHINDARSFLRHAPDGRYDLIVFGLLDSHTLLSGMSAVRLDNFVYTVESLREARRVLAPNGVVVLSFATGNAGYLSTRLHDMLKTVFEQEPRCYELGYDDGMAFVTGPGATGGPKHDTPLKSTVVQLQAGVAPAVDNWPFLYLQSPRWSDIPRYYLVLTGMLAAVSIGWVLRQSFSAGGGRASAFSPHFFFLGGAFLLIEIKGITELALLFGTTWIVNSIVIAAILLLNLLACLIVSRWPRPRPLVFYTCLAVSLLVGYFVPLSALGALGTAGAAVVGTTLLVIPLFFAALIFTNSLRSSASVPAAMSSNLLGAILGGICEYSSMVLGFRNLYLVGLALYALSLLTMPRGRSAETAAQALNESGATDANGSAGEAA
ncbi:MAG: methyltransferase domain-containing protein [Phycisphaerales bacterium]|nr:methyltransferase domain-containing protein [Phycisphaerales bacterium]